MKRSKLIAIKQALAFCIDLGIVSLPLIIAPSLESFALFVLLWVLYIPLSEFYFTQTVGMRLVGTRIYASSESGRPISFATAVRRHIARIGLLWGVLGWFLMSLGRPYHTDYLISDGEHCSVEADERGLIEVHHDNQYKVLLLVLVLMALLSTIMEHL